MNAAAAISKAKTAMLKGEFDAAFALLCEVILASEVARQKETKALISRIRKLENGLYFKGSKDS